jgi:hypothetical protein
MAVDMAAAEAAPSVFFNLPVERRNPAATVVQGSLLFGSIESETIVA